MGMHKKIYNTILKSLERGVHLPTRCNTIHNNKTVFGILLHTSFLNQFVETTVQQLGCYSSNVCSADTIFKRIKTYRWQKILLDFKTINLQLFREWVDKPKRKVYLAVDCHDVPRYIRKKRDWKPRKKKCDDIDMIVHSKKQSGTYNFHRIISVDIVDDEKFTVGFEPVLNDYDQGKLSVSLIKNVKKMINIKAVLMDRGFFRAATVDILQEHSIPFIIRVIRTKRINRFLEEFKKNRRAWCTYDYEINKTAHGRSDRRGTQVKTTVVIVDNSTVERISVEKYDENDRYFVFITNLSVDSQEIAFQLAKDFRKRWSIETGYRTKKQFRGKTCSLSYAVRLFLILLSFVLYNLWVSINSKFKHRIWHRGPRNFHLSAHLLMFLCMVHILFESISIGD
jgi:hypothetical protein